MYLDLHLHLLPNVDDGPGDLTEAIALIEALVANGWTGAVLTPHIRTDLFPNEPGSLRRETELFASDLAKKGVEFKVFPGAEQFLDERVFKTIIDGDGLPLGGAGAVHLVEAPMEGPAPGFAEQVFRLRLKGIVPLIAHPERCAVFQDIDVARRAVDSGAHLQLNLGSLAGAFGRTARTLAHRLLEEGLYTVAATDLHDAETARSSLEGWIEILDRAIGVSGRCRLLGGNPRLLLAGELVQPLREHDS